MEHGSRSKNWRKNSRELCQIKVYHHHRDWPPLKFEKFDQGEPRVKLELVKKTFNILRNPITGPSRTARDRNKNDLRGEIGKCDCTLDRSFWKFLNFLSAHQRQDDEGSCAIVLIWIHEVYTRKRRDRNSRFVSHLDFRAHSKRYFIRPLPKWVTLRAVLLTSRPSNSGRDLLGKFPLGKEMW